MELHTNKKLLTLHLILFVTGFTVLAILAFGQFTNPFDHFADLLLHDRIVQMVMFDFFFFFLWVLYWMIDRGKRSGRRVLPWVLVGILAATLMIYIFILTERKTK